MCSLLCVISKMASISFALKYLSKVYRLASLVPSPASPPAHPSAKHKLKNGWRLLCFVIFIESILHICVWLIWPCPRARLRAHPSSKHNFKNLYKMAKRRALLLLLNISPKHFAYLCLAFEYYFKVFPLPSLALAPAGLPAHSSAKHDLKNGRHFPCFSIVVESIWHIGAWLLWPCPPFLPAHPSANITFKNNERFLCTTASLPFASQYSVKAFCILVFGLSGPALPPARPPASPSAQHNFKNGRRFLCFQTLIASISSG